MTVSNAFAKLADNCLQFYQRYLAVFIKNITGSTTNCRFIPTCSHYCRQAILLYGPIRGLGKCFWRLLRCHPFSQGGSDPA